MLDYIRPFLAKADFKRVMSPLHWLNEKVQKIKAIIIITLMTDLGLSWEWCCIVVDRLHDKYAYWIMSREGLKYKLSPQKNFA